MEGSAGGRGHTASVTITKTPVVFTELQQQYVAVGKELKELHEMSRREDAQLGTANRPPPVSQVPALEEADSPQATIDLTQGGIIPQLRTITETIDLAGSDSEPSSEPALKRQKTE
jgi:hypothetical protein